MKTITFQCETITPMFLAGADGKTPELRPPSIKGALRFWWRAMNGHLPLTELKKREGEIFGNNEKRSKVVIRTEIDDFVAKEELLVPHKKFMKQKAIPVGTKFKIHLSLTSATNNFNYQKLDALFILVSALGGLGKRVRRGMGGFTIENIDYSIDEITKYLNIISPDKFKTNKNTINYTIWKGLDFPYIKSIEIGRADINLLEKISESTHEVKDIDNRGYEISLGHAYRGRFASPVYVSALKAGHTIKPIITTLNAVPNRDKYLFDIGLQKDFKAKIL